MDRKSGTRPGWALYSMLFCHHPLGNWLTLKGVRQGQDSITLTTFWKFSLAAGSGGNNLGWASCSETLGMRGDRDGAAHPELRLERRWGHVAKDRQLMSTHGDARSQSPPFGGQLKVTWLSGESAQSWSLGDGLRVVMPSAHH